MNKIALAGCIIYDDQGKILLIHRNTKKRVQWETPGGKIEENESPEQTAMREIKEEIGVGIEIIKNIGQKDFQEGDYTMKYIWFEAKIITGIPYLVEKETYDDLKYFSLEELKLKTDLSGNTQNLLAHLIHLK